MEQAKDPDLILTPMLNDWLMQHSDDAIDPAIMDRVMGVMTVPPRVRSGSFSASSAGQCLRAQEFQYLGKPKKPNYPWLRNIFQDGHFRHRRWQINLLSAGLLEEIEYPLAWPKYNSKGSADGKGYIWWDTANPKYKGKEFIWEHKGVGYRVWEKHTAPGKPIYKHIQQVHRYMLVSGIHLAIITYEDKEVAGNDGWKEFVIEADPELLKESAKELKELKNASDTQTLHPILPKCTLRTGTEYLNCDFSGKDGVCLNTTLWG